MCRWNRMAINGITISSKSSRYSRRDICRENCFVRSRHQNQQQNTRYTYRDVYAEVFHYLEIKLFPGQPLLMLAYVQHYNVLPSSNLVEQRNPSGEAIYIDAATI